MKNIKHLLTALLLLLYSTSIWAQDACTTLPKEVLISSSASSWTSEPFRFEEPIRGFRVTYFYTAGANNIYSGNNKPYVALSELSITDADGNPVAYNVTTNSLEESEGSLEALYDNDTNTFYHSVWKQGTLLDNGYVYLELTFENPLSEFTYSHTARNSSNNFFPFHFSFSNVEETCAPQSYVLGENVLGVLDEETGAFTVSGTGNIYDTPLLPIDLIKTVIIEEGVSDIGNNAFRDCTGLTSIEIPNSVTSIGGHAFCDCTSLTSIEIPNSVTSIGKYAFRDCSGLTSIVIPNSVTSIGNGVLCGCSALTSAKISSNITSIKSYMFCGCPSLTSIEIPNSVTSIGEGAFDGCSALAGIEIPDCVTSIGAWAFKNCSELTNIVIPDSVTSIGEEAFSGCSVLSSVAIPNAVTSIGDNAFSECANLKTVINFSNFTFSKGSSAYGGVAYYADKVYNLPNGFIDGDFVFGKPNGVNTLVVYLGNTEDLILPVGCKGENYEIGSSVFANLTNITSIVIPNSVTYIGKNAFYGCTGLTSVEIPNSVTSTGDAVFCRCSNLKTAKISSSLTVIKEGLFSRTGLTEIVIPEGVTSLEKWSFDNCPQLTSVVLPSSLTNIGDLVFESCTSLAEITIPNGVTSIGENVFQGCSGLTSVVVPNTVTSIGDGMFDGCSALSSVEIPDCVTSIGTRMFQYCSSLGSVVIPNSVTSIEENAFLGCSSLSSVVIPNTVTSIGNNAFSYCSALTSITSDISADNLFVIESSVFKNVNKTTCVLYVPYGTKETYASIAGWKEFTNVAEVYPAEITITINGYGSTTFCSEYALDFSNVEGLKAYTATGYNVNTQIITMMRAQTAVAGTGLFLKGEPGEYAVPVIERSGDRSMNMLVGVLKKTTVNSTSSDGVYANYKYTIKSGDTTPMFYQYSNGSSVSAGKAYLQIPLAWLPASASKAIDIRFDEGEFTDIDEIDDELKGQSGNGKTIYDLQGRVVENPTSGIYIIDGQKVFIK